MRLFFCVELDAEAKGRLAALVERLKPRLLSAKWVAPDNLHITVRFLGEVAEDRLLDLQALAREVARKFEPFHLELGTLSAFPSPRRARVLWVGPQENSERFVKLMRSVEEGVQRLGFCPETKEPRVHVTLARFKVPRDLSGAVENMEIMPPVRVDVRELTLMRSTLRPEGPIYTPVFSIPLGEG